jgi:hypothetical protein
LGGILQQGLEKSIPQLPRRRLQADPFLPRVASDIIAVEVKLQIVFLGQTRHELLVRIRLRTPQSVIEVNNGKDDPQIPAQFEQQGEQRDRIDSAGDGYANAIPGMQQIMPPNLAKHELSQSMHGTWYLSAQTPSLSGETGPRPFTMAVHEQRNQPPAPFPIKGQATGTGRGSHLRPGHSEVRRKTSRPHIGTGKLLTAPATVPTPAEAHGLQGDSTCSS